jgi:hypothetical protein
VKGKSRAPAQIPDPTIRDEDRKQSQNREQTQCSGNQCRRRNEFSGHPLKSKWNANPTRRGQHYSELNKSTLSMTGQVTEQRIRLKIWSIWTLLRNWFETTGTIGVERRQSLKAKPNGISSTNSKHRSNFISRVSFASPTIYRNWGGWWTKRQNAWSQTAKTRGHSIVCTSQWRA